MAAIPRSIYAVIEARLYERDSAVRIAAARRDAIRSRSLLRSPMGSAGGGHGSGPSSPTERAAVMLIEAETALETAEAWEAVFARIDRMYKGETEETVVRMIYREGKQQAEVAKALYMDRQTVRRAQDTYICTCAVLAAEMGLVHLGEE